VAGEGGDHHRAEGLHRLQLFQAKVQQRDATDGLFGHDRDGLAALCLWGNPSPASRHLLRRLVDELPGSVPLLLWADVDCGGLGILAQLRARLAPLYALPHGL
jgi:hypothetical protein